MRKLLIGLSAAALALGVAACSKQQSSSGESSSSSSGSTEQSTTPSATTSSSSSSSSTTSASSSSSSSSSSNQICSGTGSMQVCASSASIDQDAAKKLVAMAQSKGCLACHAVDKQVVGPAWIDVAKKFHGQANAVAELAKRIKNGGVGVWGQVQMPPQQLTDAEAKQLAQMVLALYKPSSPSSSSSSSSKENNKK